MAAEGREAGSHSRHSNLLVEAGTSTSRDTGPANTVPMLMLSRLMFAKCATGAGRL